MPREEFTVYRMSQERGFLLSFVQRYPHPLHLEVGARYVGRRRSPGSAEWARQSSGMHSTKQGMARWLLKWRSLEGEGNMWDDGCRRVWVQRDSRVFGVSSVPIAHYALRVALNIENPIVKVLPMESKQILFRWRENLRSKNKNKQPERSGKHRPTNPIPPISRTPSISIHPLHHPQTMTIFGPLGPSLAGYVRSSKSLSRWLKPVSIWYANLAGYRRIGLKYDDLRTSSPLLRSIVLYATGR